MIGTGRVIPHLPNGGAFFVIIMTNMLALLQQAPRTQIRLSAYNRKPLAL